MAACVFANLVRLSNATRTSLSCLNLFLQRNNSFTSRMVATSSSLLQHEDIEENPFFSKYADKIKKVRDLAKEGGEKKSLEEKFGHNEATRHAVERFKNKVKMNNRKGALGINQCSQSGEKAVYGNKSLDSIMHLDKVVDKSQDDIAQLWREYHQDNDCISAVIPSHLYDRIEQRSKQFPLFLYALPKEQGYEFIYSEFLKNQCYFTSLINYQGEQIIPSTQLYQALLSNGSQSLGNIVSLTLGENAPWSLVLTHFTELKESKGIVLMVGELDKQLMSVLDAQWLAYQVQLFYSTDKKNRENLLHAFNREPHTFDHMDIIREINTEIAAGTMQPQT